MDQRWLQSAPGTKYSEWQQKPSNQYTTMKHPTEEKYVVNTYYLRINEQPVHSALTKKIESNTAKSPPVGYLLSAFFKYYAFHFDYKKHIVSLNARTQSGPIEREAKAESDGWKLFGQSLSIEDPFEEFYDVAHVLKPLNFQRTKKEFALAYSKIVTCMSTDNGSLDADDLLDAICEEHVEDK
jgi:DNA polymerase sigma